MENGTTLGQLKKIKKIFYSKKIFKLIQKFQNFFIFQGLIQEIKNLIVLGSSKNLQSVSIVINCELGEGNLSNLIFCCMGLLAQIFGKLK